KKTDARGKGIVLNPLLWPSAYARPSASSSCPRCVCELRGSCDAAESCLRRIYRSLPDAQVGVLRKYLYRRVQQLPSQFGPALSLTLHLVFEYPFFTFRSLPNRS